MLNVNAGSVGDLFSDKFGRSILATFRMQLILFLAIFIGITMLIYLLVRERTHNT